MSGNLFNDPRMSLNKESKQLKLYNLDPTLRILP